MVYTGQASLELLGEARLSGGKTPRVVWFDLPVQR